MTSFQGISIACQIAIRTGPSATHTAARDAATAAAIDAAASTIQPTTAVIPVMIPIEKGVGGEIHGRHFDGKRPLVVDVERGVDAELVSAAWEQAVHFLRVVQADRRVGDNSHRSPSQIGRYIADVRIRSSRN